MYCVCFRCSRRIIYNIYGVLHVIYAVVVYFIQVDCYPTIDNGGVLDKNC